MFQEKNHLNDKITKIKLSLTEIKKKYENELLRKDMKISQQKLNYERKILELTDKTKEYEKMIEKLKTTISSHRNEKLNYEEIIFKQEETITELNDELNHNTDILNKKNEQMKQNEIYSLELIRIVKEAENTEIATTVETKYIDRIVEKEVIKTVHDTVMVTKHDTTYNENTTQTKKETNENTKEYHISIWSYRKFLRF